jgi:hypothetical protein
MIGEPNLERKEPDEDLLENREQTKLDIKELPESSGDEKVDEVVDHLIALSYYQDVVRKGMENGDHEDINGDSGTDNSKKAAELIEKELNPDAFKLIQELDERQRYLLDKKVTELMEKGYVLGEKDPVASVIKREKSKNKVENPE